MRETIARQIKVRTEFLVRVAVFGVAINGLLLLWQTLVVQLLLRGRGRLGDFTVGIPLITGLTLLYLSSLLARRKRTAWTVSLVVYGFIFAINSAALLLALANHHVNLPELLRNFVLPGAVVAGLVLTRQEFRVKSDIRSFTLSLRFSALILLVALLYGVVGFQLMDHSDFHQEIGFGEAIHRTVDQFDLTTSHSLVPYTRRARLFLDSLSIVSVGAVAYAGISLFQPLRARFADQTVSRELMAALLREHHGSSEDFFKLWPHDKGYFINNKGTAALAFHVNRGVALVVGDPAGANVDFSDLLSEFDEFCHVNDWLPAFIHTEPKDAHLYEVHGFELQKIGEEAVLDLDHFLTKVLPDKYFRQIRTRFEKLGYTTELLKPPHNEAVLNRLRAISDDWLSRPGRAERGFMMGYFSTAYLQQSAVLVARDAASTIQAFINQLPSFQHQEANFDFLRSTGDSPGNINDYLLIHFAEELKHQGFHRLNLGFSPLAGLKDDDQARSLIDSAMRFVYANGDHLFSFSGLHRFKAKYEPEWSDRFIAYRGGLRGFTRTLNALNRTMKVPVHLRPGPKPA